MRGRLATSFAATLLLTSPLLTTELSASSATDRVRVHFQVFELRDPARVGEMEAALRWRKEESEALYEKPVASPVEGLRRIQETRDLNRELHARVHDATRGLDAAMDQECIVAEGDEERVEVQEGWGPWVRYYRAESVGAEEARLEVSEPGALGRRMRLTNGVQAFEYGRPALLQWTGSSWSEEGRERSSYKVHFLTTTRARVSAASGCRTTFATGDARG